MIMRECSFACSNILEGVILSLVFRDVGTIAQTRPDREWCSAIYFLMKTKNVPLKIVCVRKLIIFGPNFIIAVLFMLTEILVSIDYSNYQRLYVDYLYSTLISFLYKESRLRACYKQQKLRLFTTIKTAIPTGC